MSLCRETVSVRLSPDSRGQPEGLEWRDSVSPLSSLSVSPDWAKEAVMADIGIIPGLAVHYFSLI